jgi:hypothetical protein
MTTLYSQVTTTFAKQNIVTVACGTTCAYLGDERNLREFLVADETARRLRRAGHTVISLLIDDSMDPLTFRQLRVAVNKDPVLLERYQHWCGKPIALLPCPWACCESYADHFEQALLNRLHYLDCHLTLIQAAKLYERGVYTPYIQQVLEHSDEIIQFLRERFRNYQPEKLFWVLCPLCGYIDETYITQVTNRTISCYCAHCDKAMHISFDDLRGKLNWKLDCAVRWAVFKIDAEAFSKSYLEPQTGSFSIAQALSQEFFGGRPVLPLHYGLVKMENKFSLKLLESLPRNTLRSMLVEHPAADMKLTRDLVVTAASRFEVLPELTYLDFVKQVLPIWLLTPHALTGEQRELVTHGIAFKKHFLNTETSLHLPRREHIQGEESEVLIAIHTLLRQIILLRETAKPSWEQFQQPAAHLINALGSRKAAALQRLRLIVGQEQGLPATHLLFFLPLDYLHMLEYLLELYLSSSVSVLDEVLAA